MAQVHTAVVVVQTHEFCGFFIVQSEITRNGLPPGVHVHVSGNQDIVLPLLLALWILKVFFLYIFKVGVLYQAESDEFLGEQ